MCNEMARKRRKRKRTKINRDIFARNQRNMLDHVYKACEIEENSDSVIEDYSSYSDSLTSRESSYSSWDSFSTGESSNDLSRASSKQDIAKMTKSNQSYTVMMVANTDFYIANPRTDNNQIEYVTDNTTEQIQNGTLVTNTNTTNAKKNFDNPVFHEEDASDNTSDNSAKSTSSDSFYDTNFKYGWLCFKPDFLQCLNKPVFFLICMVLAGIAQGLVVTGVAFTVITSIEKQFGLSSTKVGLFGTLYDTAYGFFCVFVGYIGHRHKPRWLGFGLILMVIGALVTSIPKYIVGPYNGGQGVHGLCTRNHSDALLTDDCDNSSKWYYVFLFLLGNILMGIGATPLYTLGPSHIDEITDRGQGSFYMGLYYAGAALGPALGFIIGLPILNTWVDIIQPDTFERQLEPTDANWVGAWWIGYLVGAIALSIPIIPLVGFPRLFPNTEAIKERKKQLEDTVEEDELLKHDLKSVWPATLGLLKNKAYLLICLSTAAESLAIGGFSTFIPKFVETQFHFTASQSALYTGLIVVPGAVGGILLGGYLVKRFSWNCKQILKASAVMALIAAVCVCTALVGCSGRIVVGSNNEAYYNNSSEISLNNTCNSMCGCPSKYKPICTVDDERTYFSPCHAGCKDRIDDKFYNCSCLPPNIKYAVDGRCTPECTYFPLFVVGAFLLMFFTFMNNVPMLNATFRVVPEGQGSFAMGFQQVFVRFLGFIPAPTMFGKLIDESCTLWGIDDCNGQTTNCLEYNNKNFRYYMFLLGVVTKFASFLFICFAYKVYKLPKCVASRSSASDTKSNGNLYSMKEIAAVTEKHPDSRMKSPEPSVIV